MARQQALSSWLIALPATQAITGAALESRIRSAMMPAKRRIFVNYKSFRETRFHLDLKKVAPLWSPLSCD
jgi:hypothetical protein